MVATMQDIAVQKGMPKVVGIPLVIPIQKWRIMLSVISSAVPLQKHADTPAAGLMDSGALR